MYLIFFVENEREVIKKNEIKKIFFYIYNVKLMILGIFRY